MSTIRVYIADDHAILRDGIKLILSQNSRFEVVGEAPDGKSALDEIERLKPDVAILDISMPVMTGLEAGRLIRKYNPLIKVILLSRHDDDAYVQQALQNKINGYILKEYAGSELIRAITEVMAGNLFLSPKLLNSITKKAVPHKNPHIEDSEEENDLLSNREKQVLKLIGEGLSKEEIAVILRISGQTVKVHRQNIMKKLGIHKVSELVKYGIKIGLIEI